MNLAILTPKFVTISANDSKMIKIVEFISFDNFWDFLEHTSQVIKRHT